MADLGATMRVLQPAPGILAFYDGRIEGRRAWSAGPNWLDDGAYVLGIASYAVVDGPHALVYDSHVSLPHARRIRAELEGRGVTSFTLVLSHAHLDHVAGNEVFADSPIIAHTLTRQLMQERRGAIEAGTQAGPPAIRPLVLPTQVYDGELALRIGGTQVLLRHADIHSRDGTVLLLPAQRLLLAGDTLEDTVTYVAEPARIERHRVDLARMASWDLGRILPNHGAEDRIAAGGYSPDLVWATDRYLGHLAAARTDAAVAARPLREVIAADLSAGHLAWFEPYEAVHRRNVEAVRASEPE